MKNQQLRKLELPMGSLQTFGDLREKIALFVFSSRDVLIALLGLAVKS